jgi:hypothetical protein
MPGLHAAKVWWFGGILCAADFVFRQPRNPVFQQFSKCIGFKIARIPSGGGSSARSVCCVKMPNSPLFVRAWE